ncbi:tyrosine-type recombinase/integrase [Bosea sp. (in: a-proteobacteria)]|uniref:tyrosine-type recombinase/integrase n=1 Tax=Bosea sp. (in: a-proteobacteria) TaxID=1871050 RepID=UPI0027365731|nr:tyrosine-type recombinase/integrase [Bosea sp. (in: a-proteobacteria)]MDP3409026.1 tyrosine-type recombinase/integrase [Bosea sp. (in: a-proteobacteria)]
MPRRAKGPRLYFRERWGREGVWVILDRGREHSTGCGESEREQAEGELAQYLARTRLKQASRSDPSQILIADVLNLYVETRAKDLARGDTVAGLTLLLLQHAKGARCDAINADWCRRYVDLRVEGKIAPDTLPGRKPKRPKRSSVRRDLEHLRACLSHAVKEGVLAYAPAITYPAAPQPRQRFLTRAEAARLLWTCWRYKQHGPKNQILRPLRHLCRFILIGLYSGTRSSAILSASFTAGADRSYIDLSQGTYFRLAEGRAVTNKRQPPIGLPDRLLAHLRRWQPKTNSGWVITFHGEPVASVKKGFSRACKLAGLEGVTPHVLRHSFMTWVLTSGMDLHTAAKVAGMSAKVADRVYGHLDVSRRDGLNAAFGPRNRGHIMGAGRTSAARQI